MCGLERRALAPGLTGRRMSFGYARRMTTQIAVKLPDGLVAAIDRLVDEGTFPRRSAAVRRARSEENTCELQSLMRTSYAVFCLERKPDRKTPIQASIMLII